MKLLTNRYEGQLLLPERTLRKEDNNLNTFPNYQQPFKPVFRKGKHWKKCNSELNIMKKKLDKLSPAYEQAKALGLHVKAKRMFKKALQLSKRISALLRVG